MAESSSSTATAPKPKSDTEIEEMLDRMLTRLALCDDSKLEPLLSKLLPLTISSLSSSSTAVRNKVLRRRISISLLLHHRKLLITQLLSYKLVSISHFMLKLLN
jgi:proteasome component ECM29